MWLQTIGKADLIGSKISNRLRVCKKHFSTKMFAKSGRKLKRKAVPFKMVSTIVPSDELKCNKNYVPTIDQHLSVNQQSKHNQTEVKTMVIQSRTPVKILPAHIVVETVFMTREEYNRKMLEKITLPAPLSLTAQVKKKNQTEFKTSTDSSMFNHATISKSNIKKGNNCRDVDSILNKYCDLLELQIKSESRLILNEYEKQRRKIQRFNNISKMKLSSKNALQILIFLQNSFFNITIPESYTKQQDRQQQPLNTTFTSLCSRSEPLLTSSTSSYPLELLSSDSNDSEKCFSFRPEPESEQQDNQHNLIQFQKQEKCAQNSAEISLSNIQLPLKMLRSSEKLLQSNSCYLNPPLILPVTGGITQKEPEDFLDFINIFEPQIKMEAPDETI